MSNNNKVFKFKKFSLQHSESSHKVGFDSVFFAACLKPSLNSQILDVGCGCGVIGLLLKFYHQSYIDFIDINEEAIALTLLNHNNIFDVIPEVCVVANYSDWAVHQIKRYDMIVSNPPYYHDGLKAKNIIKSQAKHAESLSYLSLLQFSGSLLNPNGKLAFIYDAKLTDKILDLGLELGWYIYSLIYVYSKEHDTSPIRTIFQFGRDKLNSPIISESYYIRDEKGIYSNQYINLTANMYFNDLSKFR